MDVTSDIITAQENIRNKYLSINRGKIDEERVLDEAFKPITKPLKELVELGSKTPQLPQQQQQQKQPSTKSAKKKSTGLAQRYLDLVKTNRWGTDQTYGIRPSSGGYMIGSHQIKIDGDDIVIGNTRYPGTEGLYELLVKKKPGGYDNEDLNNFWTIQKQTNAYKQGYLPNATINDSSRDFKFINIIKQKLASHQGSGLFKTFHRQRAVDYKYYDDPNELVNRLRLLLASQESGSSAHDNEIIEILSELRDLKLI